MQLCLSIRLLFKRFGVGKIFFNVCINNTVKTVHSLTKKNNNNFTIVKYYNNLK